MSEPNEQPNTPDDGRELPKFSRRLGAPIATVKPVGKPPSQVSGLPSRSGAVDRQAPPGGDGPEQQSFYEAVGGRKTFQTIVDVFYDQVAEDPDFRAMYPEEDLGPAKERLLTFLEQYWGGPRTYQEQRGHPRLRMRHFAFPIDVAARDAWLTNMQRAMHEVGIAPEHEAQLWSYLTRAADSMRNTE